MSAFVMLSREFQMVPCVNFKLGTHFWQYSQKHACRWLEDSPSSQKWSDHPLWLEEWAPTHAREIDVSSKVECQHTTFKQASTTEQQSPQSYLALKVVSLQDALPSPSFWQLDPSKPPADRPLARPCTQISLDGASLGFRVLWQAWIRAGENVAGTFCGITQIYNSWKFSWFTNN